MVVDGETGVLAERGDAAALADALVELLTDPARRKQMGDAARDHVRERFGSARLIDDLERLYDELLD